MGMAAADDAREKMREVNAELHVVKNRLFRLVLEEMEMDYEEDFWEENNMVGFAFSDAPSVAKVINEISKEQRF
jgi:large subunit ribosomal protein L10